MIFGFIMTTTSPQTVQVPSRWGRMAEGSTFEDEGPPGHLTGWHFWWVSMSFHVCFQCYFQFVVCFLAELYTYEFLPHQHHLWFLWVFAGDDMEVQTEAWFPDRPSCVWEFFRSALPKVMAIFHEWHHWNWGTMRYPIFRHPSLFHFVFPGGHEDDNY